MLTVPMPPFDTFQQEVTVASTKTPEIVAGIPRPVLWRGGMAG